MSDFLFYFFGIISVVSASFVVLSKKPIYCVLALVITMFALSGIFVSLNAHFIAALQILIYAGAILVLFLFVLMLFGIEGADYFESNPKIKLALKTLLAVAFLGELLIAARYFQTSGNVTNQKLIGSVEAIGRSLFSEHLLAFELISLLLFVGIIGVVHLTKKEKSV